MPPPVRCRSLALYTLVTVAGACAARRAHAQQSPAAAQTVPEPAPPPSPVPAPSPEEVRHRRVGVDVDSTKPATVIERRISLSENSGNYVLLPYHSTEAVWEQVCVTPCQVDLDRFSSYRVSNLNGVVSSRTFTLPQGLDRLSVRIEPGNATAHRVGATTLGIGTAAFLAGAGLIAAQKLFHDEQAARTAGFITGGAGLVLLAIGIPVTILTHTKVLANGSRIALTPRGLVF
ncbi:MAG TPA: hypothetical protein VE987_14825 [Polyangiaceae bacterium]|nr:hypothetical protein [Polyangiaceae bacterium]